MQKNLCFADIHRRKPIGGEQDTDGCIAQCPQRPPPCQLL